MRRFKNTVLWYHSLADEISNAVVAITTPKGILGFNRLSPDHTVGLIESSGSEIRTTAKEAIRLLQEDGWLAKEE